MIRRDEHDSREEEYMIRRDENGLHVDFDVLFIYLIALVVLVVAAIKAIRWAMTS